MKFVIDLNRDSEQMAAWCEKAWEAASALAKQSFADKIIARLFSEVDGGGFDDDARYALAERVREIVIAHAETEYVQSKVRSMADDKIREEMGNLPPKVVKMVSAICDGSLAETVTQSVQGDVRKTAKEEWEKILSGERDWLRNVVQEAVKSEVAKAIANRHVAIYEMVDEEIAKRKGE